jgi:hypothetical protein
LQPASTINHATKMLGVEVKNCIRKTVVDVVRAESREL